MTDNLDPQALIAELRSFTRPHLTSQDQPFRYMQVMVEAADALEGALTEAPATQWDDEADEPSYGTCELEHYAGTTCEVCGFRKRPAPTPASTDARETLIAILLSDYSWDDGFEPPQFCPPNAADAILAAGFALSVTRDDAKAEGFQWDYRTAFNGDTERRLVGPYEFFAATYRATSGDGQ